MTRYASWFIRMMFFRAGCLLLDDEDAYQRMSHAVNPYGDGHASGKIVDILQEWAEERGRG